MKKLVVQKIADWIEKKKFTVEQVFNAAKDLGDITETELLKFMAEQYYEKNEHVNCLICLDFCANIVDEEQKKAVLCSMLQEYYGKNIAESRKQYEDNRQILQKNIYFERLKMLPAEELSALIIYQNEQEYIYIDRNNGELCIEKKEQLNYPAGIYAKQYLLYDINTLTNLEQLAENIQGRESLNYTGKKYALMIYYDTADRLALILQTGGIFQGVFSQDRIIFMVGEDSFVEYRFLLPYLEQNCILAASVEKKTLIIGKLEDFYCKIGETMQNLHEKNMQYYKNNSEKLLVRIRAKKARIMVIATHFATAFPDREYYNACERLGLPVYFLGEKSPLAGLGVHHWELVEAINEFHPDIILYVDNFAQREIIPEEIIFINWVCTVDYKIFSKNRIDNINPQDYFLAHSPSREIMITGGYLANKVLGGMVPTNHHLFTSFEFEKKYEVDIALVANFNSYADKIREMGNIFCDEPTLRAIMVASGEEFYQDLYYERVNILTVEDITRYFLEKLKKYGYKKIIVANLFKSMMKNFYLYSRASAFRTVLAEWLIDGGYTNLKLYGNDWAANPKFAPYAMGVAPYGVPLVKIYQRAKIILGTNPITTATARLSECFLSGGFYIGNYIEPQADFIDIRKVGDGAIKVPFFHGRDDLYNKLDYYLANTQERENVTANVRQELLKYSTYDVLVKNTMQWLADEVGR